MDFDDVFIKKNMADRGFQITGIAVMEKGHDPMFIIYTTGLTKWELPEVIIVDMPVEPGGELVDWIANEMMDGNKFEVNKVGIQISDEDLLPFTVIPVSEVNAKKYMQVTSYHFPNFRAHQFIWSDDNKNFPWEDNFQSFYCKKQRLLGELDVS